MDNTLSYDYFLGSNSPQGFYSLYDGFIDLESGDFLWVIKGGPGCGKSSFMKKIGKAAVEKGFETEYICCSGDPNSLDGVYIPELKTGYVDGTSPHVIEAVYPGSASMYLDLGAAFDTEKLSAQRGEISSLTQSYKQMYERAYAMISAAGDVSPKYYFARYCQAAAKAAADRASSTAVRELGRIPKQLPERGRRKLRFVSAFTCQGRIVLTDTINTQCEKLFLLDNDYGLASEYLAVMAEEVAVRGLDAVLCPDPMFPDRLEALLLPGQGLGFVASETRSPIVEKPYRHVRLDALITREELRAVRTDMRASRRLYEQLMEEAHASLARAKAYHDDLERIYNPRVDFDYVYETADRHIAALFG